MRYRKLSSALLAALAFTGCSSALEKDASYESARDLATALRAAGHSCKEFTDEDTSDDFDAGECDGMQIRVYPSEEALAADAKGILIGSALAIVAANKDVMIVSTKNWTALAPSDDASRIADNLGAEVLNPADYDLAQALGTPGQ